MLEVCQGAVRLWRSNVGLAWTGDKYWHVDPCHLVIKNPRPFRAGFKGLSDLTGYKTITITPDMVGQKIAVFAAVEVKAARGRPTKEQTAFLNRVREAGGLAGIAKSAEEAERILNP